MNETFPPYEAPHVVESLDEVDVLGSAPGTLTEVPGSGTVLHAI
jgi:hypothetical protein